MADTSVPGSGLPVIEHPGTACEAVRQPDERGVWINAYVRRPAGSTIDAHHDEWSGAVAPEIAARLCQALDDWCARLRAATGFRIITLSGFDTGEAGCAAIPDPTPEIVDLISRSVPADVWRTQTIDATISIRLEGRVVRVSSSITTEPDSLHANPLLRKGLSRIFAAWIRAVHPVVRRIDQISLDIRIPPPASGHEAMRRMASRAAARHSGSA